MDLVLSCYLPVNNIKHSLWFVGLEEILTPKEKILLYEAIGYSETAVDPTLPKTVKMFCCLIPEYLLIDSPNFNPFRKYKLLMCPVIWLWICKYCIWFSFCSRNKIFSVTWLFKKFYVMFNFSLCLVLVVCGDPLICEGCFWSIFLVFGRDKLYK